MTQPGIEPRALDFELAYYDATVQHANPYVVRLPSENIWIQNFLKSISLKVNHIDCTLTITSQELPCLVCFLCLMAYQPSWIILSQSHPFRTTVVVLLNL